MNRTTLRAAQILMLRVAPICVVLTAISPALSTHAAHAETVVEEEEFRDWVHRCEYETESSAINCFVYTGKVADYEGENLASRIVVILMHDGNPIVYLDVPDRAEPADGFVLQIDQRPPFSGRFNDCSTGWCHTQALGDVALELIKQFQAGSEAKVTFFLDQPAVQIDLPLSLLGFTAAFTRLNEVHAELIAAMREQEAEAAAAAAAEAEAAEEAAGEAPDDENAEDLGGDDTAPSDGEPPAGDGPPVGDVPEAAAPADLPVEE